MVLVQSTFKVDDNANREPPYAAKNKHPERRLTHESERELIGAEVSVSRTQICESASPSKATKRHSTEATKGRTAATRFTGRTVASWLGALMGSRFTELVRGSVRNHLPFRHHNERLAVSIPEPVLGRQD